MTISIDKVLDIVSINNRQHVVYLGQDPKYYFIYFYSQTIEDREVPFRDKIMAVDICNGVSDFAVIIVNSDSVDIKAYSTIRLKNDNKHDIYCAIFNFINKKETISKLNNILLLR